VRQLKVNKISAAATEELSDFDKTLLVLNKYRKLKIYMLV